MKHSFLLAMAVLSGGAFIAVAQTPAASTAVAPAADGPAKIAVISFQAAVGQTNEFQRNYADLQKKYDPKRQQMKSLSDEVDNLTKQLQTQGEQLNETERASRAKAIDDKKKQLQRLGEDAQSDFQQELQQTFGGVAQKVGEVLTTFAQQHGYALVLDGGQEEAASVLYHTDSTDITKAIIDAYNTKSGVPAPTQIPSAPTPKGPTGK